MADFNLRAAEYFKDCLEFHVLRPITDAPQDILYIADASDLAIMVECEIDERIDCAHLIWQQIEELE